MNMDGEVVGINSAKLASTEVEGMGYAIAISDVTDILENLMNETARNKLDDEDHGVLGIKGQTVDSQAVCISENVRLLKRMIFRLAFMYTRLWMEVQLRRLA